MQLYIYAKSGHNFGLENVRRASALYKELIEFKPILCTADYRAATFAKQYLDVTTGMGIDIIGNLPNVMERGDMLIFDDSNEASSTMQEHIKEFCTLSYKVKEDINLPIIDKDYFTDTTKQYDMAIFFSDDDYSNYFLDFCKDSQKYDIPLIWGHYFFYGNEKELEKSFSEILEEDEYKAGIKSTKYLITASVQAALESLASGNYPIFFTREDKQVENLDLIKKYNIPTILAVNLDELVKNAQNVIKNYPKLNSIEKLNIEDIKDQISKKLEIFKKIHQPSLEYKFSYED